MFTGIITHIGEIKTTSRTEEGSDIEITSELYLDNKSLKIGDSISINGVCLTIVSKENNKACFNVASETLRKTTLGSLVDFTKVNLESSLKIETP